jgi:hypothetical protein
VLVVGIFVLAGCATPAAPPVYAPISFSDQTRIRFAVGAVQVISDYISTGKAPHIAHEFPFSPERALWQWAEDGLQAAGDWGRVEMTIRDAFIRRDPLSTEGGILSVFKKEQSERYTASLVVTFAVENNERAGAAAIRVSRSRTFPEGMSLNQTDAARHDFLRAIIADFNTEAERTISRDLGGFLSANNA